MLLVGRGDEIEGTNSGSPARYWYARWDAEGQAWRRKWCDEHELVVDTGIGTESGGRQFK